MNASELAVGAACDGNLDSLDDFLSSPHESTTPTNSKQLRSKEQSGLISFSLAVPIRSSLKTRFTGRKAQELRRHSASPSILPHERGRADVGKAPGYLPPAAGAKPIKSCLSVTNLEDSLHSCGLPKSSRRNSMPDLACLGASGQIKRTVSFHKVEFRNYNVCPGDHPATRVGPPISLDWRFDPNHEVQHLDDYESARPPRRDRSALKMTRKAREARLLQEGYSEGQILRAEIATDNTKKQRSKTNQKLHMQPAQEVLESAGRKLKRLVTLSSKKKEEEKLWEDAHQKAQEKWPIRQVTIGNSSNNPRADLSPPSNSDDNNPVMKTEFDTSTDKVSGKSPAIIEISTPPPTPIEEKKETSEAQEDDDWGFGLDGESSW